MVRKMTCSRQVFNKLQKKSQLYFFILFFFVLDMIETELDAFLDMPLPPARNTKAEVFDALTQFMPYMDKAMEEKLVRHHKFMSEMQEFFTELMQQVQHVGATAESHFQQAGRLHTDFLSDLRRDVSSDAVAQSDRIRQDFTKILSDFQKDLLGTFTASDARTAALRADMQVQNDALRAEMQAQTAALRAEMQAQTTVLRADMQMLRAQNCALADSVMSFAAQSEEARLKGH